MSKPDGMQREVLVVLPGLMLAMMLAMLDNFIVGTAMPRIVGELGGLDHLSWVVTAYVLGTTVSTPIWGKIGDQFGRKTIFLAAIAIFLVGSALCGAAGSSAFGGTGDGMAELIAFRAIQGLGAGAVQPTAMTIIGDIYTVAERAKVQGYVASVWAISSVVGPTLGGVFVEVLDWRWIFFVNVPLGVVAAWVLHRRFTEDVTKAEHRIDYRGAALLTVGTSLLVLGLLEGGVRWDWLSAPGIGVLAVAVLALVVFALVERRAAEPVIPPWVFRSRLLNTTNLASLAIGVVLIGLTSYVPLYVQGVLGHNALVAGFALAALTLGWPIAASSAGRVYLRVGFRLTALMGCAFILVGVALLVLIGPGSSVWSVAGTCFVIGLGMGLTASPTLIAGQAAAEWAVRGVVTGTNMFARSMGSAVGIAVFGAVANTSLARSGGGSVSTTAAGIPPEARDPALHAVFVGTAAVAVVLTLAVLLMPRTPPHGQD